MSKAEIIKLVIECMFYAAIAIIALAAPIAFWRDNDCPYSSWLGLITMYGCSIFGAAIIAGGVWLVFNV